MLYLPGKLCCHPACNRLAGPNGYCSKHGAPPKDATRHRLYDRDWQRESKIYLADHPWCVECLKEGKHVPATVVDHIKPHRGDRRLFWDRYNWQGLCEHHHNQKTARGE